MKEFVFLYPVREFIGTIVHPVFADRVGPFVREIIAARYQERGFHINWVFFAYPENTNLPDLTRTASFVDLRNRSRVINSGVTFNEMTRHRRYPREEHILAQIAKLAPINEIMITGFHQWDCVDRFARYCYHAGITTSVDEDLTDVGITRSVEKFRESKEFDVSLPNSGLSIEFGRHANNPFAGAAVISAAREARADRPWFFQL